VILEEKSINKMLFPFKTTAKEKWLTCHWSGPGPGGCWHVCRFCVDSENL